MLIFFILLLIECHDDMLSQNEIESSSLFSGKKFGTWDECEFFLNEWAKDKGFHFFKGRVTRKNGVLRRRTYLCNHGGFTNQILKKIQLLKRCNVLILSMLHVLKLTI